MPARDRHPRYDEALRVFRATRRVSTSFLQRYLKIGYNEAAGIVEELERDGHVTQPDHVGRRQLVADGAGALAAGERLAASVQKTPHRVTLADLEEKIAHEEYLNPEVQSHLTICVLVLTNGFSIVGKSAPADPENFDIAVGRKFAREDAIRQIWPFEGYLLREWMSTS